MRKTARKFSINRGCHIKTDVKVCLVLSMSLRNKVLQESKHFKINHKRVLPPTAITKTKIGFYASASHLSAILFIYKK